MAQVPRAPAAKEVAPNAPPMAPASRDGIVGGRTRRSEAAPRLRRDAEPLRLSAGRVDSMSGQRWGAGESRRRFGGLRRWSDYEVSGGKDRNGTGGFVERDGGAAGVGRARLWQQRRLFQQRHLYRLLFARLRPRHRSPGRAVCAGSSYPGRPKPPAPVDLADHSAPALRRLSRARCDPALQHVCSPPAALVPYTTLAAPAARLVPLTTPSRRKLPIAGDRNRRALAPAAPPRRPWNCRSRRRPARLGRR